MTSRDLALHLAAVCVPVTCLLLLLELAVRVTGAAEGCSARASVSEFLVCDPILGYKVNPDREPLGEALNAAGFRTHEFAPKPPGVYRILALGDSCTFGVIGLTYVSEPYPRALERRIAERAGPGRVEVLNAGQGGYGTWHGVMLLRSKLRGLDPDLITVRYGWNDLLLSPGRTRLPESRLAFAIEDALLRTKSYAFLRRVVIELRALVQPAAERSLASYAALREWQPAVPLEEFERNLRRIVEIGRGRGADVWLLTLPRSPNPSERAARRLSQHSRLSVERLAAIHDAYNDAIRAVGSSLGAPVVDVQRAYAEDPATVRFIPTDLIHPNQAGHDLEAELLYQRLVALGIVAPREREGTAARGRDS